MPLTLRDNVDSVTPTASMSSSVKLLPGSSLKRNVTLPGGILFVTFVGALTMLTVGTTWSILKLRPGPATAGLPARSTQPLPEAVWMANSTKPLDWAAFGTV